MQGDANGLCAGEQTIANPDHKLAAVYLDVMQPAPEMK
jgi:hypothetical protein